MINVQETFEKFSDKEFLKFDRVENKLHSRQDICAFILLDKLVPVNGDCDMVACAEHDVIWLQPDIEKLGEVATEEDILTLVRCGVMFDESVECLSMFV